MLEKTLERVLLVLGIVAILLILLLIFVPTSSEEFVELYFSEPLDLPSSIELDETYYFDFLIISSFEEELDYTYTIYLELDSDKEEIAQNSISLSSGDSALITETFEVNEGFDSARVIIELEDQEIYFWLEAIE